MKSDSPFSSFCNRRTSLPVRGAWIEIRVMKLREYRKSCRSLRGERGLKFRIGVICTIHICRSLRGERGLKLHTGKNEKKEAASLPERGASIEIQSAKTRNAPITRRALRGERGLKIPLALRFLQDYPSLPKRGAWIEIRCCWQASRQPRVAP